MSTEALFVGSLPLMRRVIRQVAAGGRLSRDQESEFASAVILKFIDNDYRLLRAFRGQSSLQTYMFAVVRRLLLDLRVREWGKWRPSRRAQQLGSKAVCLERMMARDGLSVGEAVGTAMTKGWGVTSEEAWRLAEALPRRIPRIRAVALNSGVDQAGADRADAAVEMQELQARSRHVRATLAAQLTKLDAVDRQILRMRFVDGTPIRDIAAAVGVDPAAFYRRFDALMRRMRLALAEQAVTRSTVHPLLGHAVAGVSSVLSESSTHC